MTIEPVMIREPAELDGVFMAFDKNRPDALIMQPSLPVARVAALALKHRIPSVSTLRAFSSSRRWTHRGSSPPRAGSAPDR